MEENGSTVMAVSVASTFDQRINGVLGGTRWSGGTVSYSNPDSVNDYQNPASPNLVGFSAFSAQQMTAVHGFLNANPMLSNPAMFGFSVEGFTGLTVNHSGNGSGLGTIRYANSSAPSTAFAFLPSNNANGGDAFFGPSGRSPDVGDYDYYTLLHETGHTLGLKHGHETGVYGALPFNTDSMEFSVMTYKSYVGSDAKFLYNGSVDFAQTFMQYDIAALQYMYGADFTTNADNTVYSWNPATGDTLVNGVVALDPLGNRIFETVWDGGGFDTYKFSNYAEDLEIDLTPGGWSTLDIDQLAYLGNGNLARGNVFNALQYQGDARSLIESAVGGSGNDTIIGNIVDNVLIGGAGNDELFGGSGNDTLEGEAGINVLHGDSGTDAAKFSGPMHNYTFGWIGDGAVSTDALDSIEQLNFSNISLAIGDRTKVDPLFYLGVNVDVKNADMDPTYHYRNWGWHEGRNPNPNVNLATFESLDYIASYADLIAAFGTNAQAGHDHFAQHGLFEGRSVNFDDMQYLASYDDLILAFHDMAAQDSGSDIGAQHFIPYGFYEGRVRDDFDSEQYLANYSDLQAAFGADQHLAAWHFVVAGYFEGRTDHA